jgi:hypothetical protein
MPCDTHHTGRQVAVADGLEKRRFATIVGLDVVDLDLGRIDDDLTHVRYGLGLVNGQLAIFEHLHGIEQAVAQVTDAFST